MEQYLPYILTGIIFPLSLFLFYRKINKADKVRTVREEERTKRENESSQTRQQENIIIMKSLRTLGHLGEATAIAIINGKVNGEMKTAMAYYTETKDELNDYLLEQNARANHG